MPRILALTLLLLLASAAEPVGARLGFACQGTVAQLTALRLTGAGLALWLLIGRRSSLPLGRRLAPLAALVLAYNLLLMTSLALLPGSVVATALAAIPAFVGIFAGRKAAPGFWLGAVLALLGVGFLSGGLATGSSVLGWTCLGLAVIASAYYRVRAETSTRWIEPVLVSAHVFGLNALLAGAALPFLGPYSPSIVLWGLLLGLAAAAHSLAFLALVRDLGAGRSSLLAVALRPAVVLLAALTLGEWLTPAQWLGVTLTLVGAYVAQRGLPAVRPLRSQPRRLPWRVVMPLRTRQLDRPVRLPSRTRDRL